MSSSKRLRQTTILATILVLGVLALAPLLAEGASHEPPGPAPVAGTATPEEIYAYAWKWLEYLNQPLGAEPRWETWPDPWYVFNPKNGSDARYFQTEKSDGVGDDLVPNPDLQAGSDWPLIDQLGNYAVHEIRINEKMKNYIEKERPGGEFGGGGQCRAKGCDECKNLTTLTCLCCYREPIDFPWGSASLKAGWRMFPEDWNRDPEKEQIVSRYYTRRETTIKVLRTRFLPQDYGDEDLCEPRSSAVCIRNVQLGLVALHVVVKPVGHPGWIWATFEHVDNYEVGSDAPPGLTPTFHSLSSQPDPCTENRQPQCLGELIGTARCKYSLPPPSNQPAPCKGLGPRWVPQDTYYWQVTTPTAGYYQESQIGRAGNEIAVAEAWRSKMSDEPWKYYRLVAVQWFKDAELVDGKLVAGTPLPKNGDNVSIARNTALESYLIASQTIAAQVPGVNLFQSDAELGAQLSTNNSQSTLMDMIVGSRLSPSQAGTYTYSSCISCHQMASPSVTKVSEDGSKAKRVATDFSFIFRTYLQH